MAAWTQAELAESQNAANQYYTSHQAPQGWTPDDVNQQYLYWRQQGYSHADSLAHMNALGWTANPTPAAAGPSNDQMAGFYQDNLGRPGTPEEYAKWISDYGGDANRIRQGIYDSAEAAAYRAKQTGGGTTGGGSTGGGGGAAPAGPAGPATAAPGWSAPAGPPSSGFGAAPPTYQSDPNAPTFTPLPDYKAPTWTGGDFVNPSEEDLKSSPGYQARLDQLIKTKTRQAAAQGTVLSGGTLVALDRAGQDYATNEYQTFRNNALDAYKQKYSQFTDAAGMDLNARTINANQNQATFANRTQTYNTGNARTLSDYLTNVTAQRNAELDYWNRLNDVNQTGAQLAGSSYKAP
jgi:hypothetical protein